MAKEIALSIKVNVNGTEKVITNIQETENAVKALREELATTSFGTARWEAIRKDLRLLRSQLEDVDKATEGLGMEKRLRAINDATNLLTGSFSLLTGALTLASANEEDLIKVQQAEAKAMAAVNIVLGVRAIGEGLLESRVLRREAAEKISITTSKIYIATAKGISASLKAVGINAGVASVGVRALTSALAALGIPALIVGLGLLYDYLTDTNEALESKAPVTAKEYYDDLKKSIDEVAAAEKLRADNFIASGGSEKEALERRVVVAKNAYDDLNEKQKENYNELARAQEQVSRNEDVFYSKAKTRAQQRVKQIEDNIDKTLDLLIAADTDVKNSEKDLTDYTTKQEEERVKKAKEAADKIKAIKLKDIQDRLAIQLKYIEYLNQLGDTEIKVEADVIEKVKQVIADQNQLLELRAKNAQSAKEKLEEELKIDLFKVIPKEDEKKLFLDTFLTIFTTLNKELEAGNTEILAGTNKTLDQLVELAIKIKQADPLSSITSDAGLTQLEEYSKRSKRIGEINEELGKTFTGTFDEMASHAMKTMVLREELDKLKKEQDKLFTEEGRKSLVNYFNTFTQYAKELSSKNLKALFQIEISEGDALKALQNVVNKAQDILENETILPGDLPRVLADRVVDELKTLGLVYKSTAGLNEVAKAEAEAYNKKLEEFVGILVQLGITSANTRLDVAKVGEELKTLTKTSEENEKALRRQGKTLNDVLDLSAAEFDNVAEKIRTAASASPQAFTEFVQDLIQNTGAVREVVDETGNVVVKGVKGIRDQYLEILSPDRLIKLLQEGAKGLKDVNFETEKDITDLITTLTNLELMLGDSITTTINNIDGTTEVVGSGYANFAEIIEKLKEKLKELQEENKDTAKSFEEIFSESKFKKIADMILSIFTDLSQRISDVSAQQSSLMLEKLEYEKEETLAKIGEANTKSDKENKKILEERAKIEKQYAKEKFNADKNARVSELQFGLANAVAQSAQAIINTYATLPIPAAIPFSLLLAGITIAQIATINDQLQFTKSKQFIGRRGGLIQGATHEDGGVPALLEGGEFVMSRAAVDTYGDTLGMMNASVGARPLAIDDSRIVQAIAKQNTSTKVPLKTYVLYNDIQNTEKLNNKIEQLARL